MNTDSILAALNQSGTEYILIGGMNFLLRHSPILTFDVDVWVRDTNDNLGKLNGALISIEAKWGPTEKDWESVSTDFNWLKRQSLFCMTTKHGALDVFRSVKGLECGFEECLLRTERIETARGIFVQSLSDEDMLKCQEALDVGDQKLERIRILRSKLNVQSNEN